LVFVPPAPIEIGNVPASTLKPVFTKWPPPPPPPLVFEPPCHAVPPPPPPATKRTSTVPGPPAATKFDEEVNKCVV
jgi:hypothetical protein